MEMEGTYGNRSLPKSPDAERAGNGTPPARTNHPFMLTTMKNLSTA
jgi:hypothetical protein